MHHHSRKKLLHALHRVQGTLKGIEKMFLENRPLSDISLQFQASRAALNSLCDKKFLTLFREDLFYRIFILQETNSQNTALVKTLENIKQQLNHANCIQLWHISKLINRFEQKSNS